VRKFAEKWPRIVMLWHVVVVVVVVVVVLLFLIIF